MNKLKIMIFWVLGFADTEAKILVKEAGGINRKAVNIFDFGHTLARQFLKNLFSKILIRFCW